MRSGSTTVHHPRVFDRRVRRSPDRVTALVYQLEAARAKVGVEAIVVADRDGLALASSGDRAICAELAAVAPLLGRHIFGLMLPPLLAGADLAVDVLAAEGQPLYVGCVGTRNELDAIVDELRAAVQRILRVN